MIKDFVSETAMGMLFSLPIMEVSQIESILYSNLED